MVVQELHSSCAIVLWISLYIIENKQKFSYVKMMIMYSGMHSM